MKSQLFPPSVIMEAEPRWGQVLGVLRMKEWAQSKGGSVWIE